ncbi:30S ribosomal protein S17 [Corynebacterium pseudodiphtheriticum]|uniref:30S ribosomal protein S17 n=1 Tax=Corynebacterium pseudodiphtheriticum TaxID=37637 RepID=UPI001EF74756|nr:30S ribosomal protein S17 [Corynebacterium pseudodiphtheriticum]MDC7113670.1 30S ribosomal protein S17 [Corynebacterium pseudodiphtheriticum]MDK4206485.1 30S ribosomal protein S17 [Corynebacterium pseudodiphtheriticum]MDK4274534.1 30S ribosomal protein S17 [Corynebacterium pseudodiphtheriticum]MDK4285275.1 30S ribosomal protein S17 [Corynebacterium pseudodiphtheriticum]MDK4289048.1 30S ribosomal protein S17 [Corynebacterium pseudodiphtheriticum]
MSFLPRIDIRGGNHLHCHALYGKIMRSDSCVKDHDENETAGVGDRDRIEETRPLSKDKRFRLVEIIERRASFL